MQADLTDRLETAYAHLVVQASLGRPMSAVIVEVNATDSLAFDEGDRLLDGRLVCVSISGTDAFLVLSDKARGWMQDTSLRQLDVFSKSIQRRVRAMSQDPEC